MDSGFEKQLERIEKIAAEILDAVRAFRDRRLAGLSHAAEINERLSRFLEERK
jgi:hypothetical protein